MNTEIFIDVPYSEKEEAKQLGARWNPGKKSWFIPKDVDKNDFSRWLPIEADENTCYRAMRSAGSAVKKQMFFVWPLQVLKKKVSSLMDSLCIQI